jgi:hypothetical protein
MIPTFEELGIRLVPHSYLGKGFLIGTVKAGMQSLRIKAPTRTSGEGAAV